MQMSRPIYVGGEVARKMRLDSTQQVESEKCDLTRLDLESVKSNEIERFPILRLNSNYIL